MRRLGGLGLAVALAALAAACGRERSGAGVGASAEERVTERVRQTYTQSDAVAAAAYTWTSPVGAIFVLVDVESGTAGVVQSRADLWVDTDSAPVRIARSDVMASAASIGVFAFEDVTGDGIPDLLGYVADSAGVSYPIFLVGARGSIGDQIETAAPGYRFSADPEAAPRVYGGPHGPCGIQLWADEPAPDSQPAGWRYLLVQRGTQLAPPAVQPPSCP
ncbi:MAG: hypothetical protein ABSG61_03630 [Gemmatimonadales bacterium]